MRRYYVKTKLLIHPQISLPFGIHVYCPPLWNLFYSVETESKRHKVITLNRKKVSHKMKNSVETETHTQVPGESMILKTIVFLS